MKCSRSCWLNIAALLTIGTTSGCSLESAPSVTRLHLENASDIPVTFFALGNSEQEVAAADNRLLRPLEPDGVYSALLVRPGNYWLRAQFEQGGHVIERIVGPIRFSRGISAWQFETLDEQPIYPEAPWERTTSVLDRDQPRRQLAGRISFKSSWIEVSPRQELNCGV